MVKLPLLLLILFCSSNAAYAYTAMHNAIVKSDLKKVEALLSKGADINAKHDGMKMSALQLATLYKDEKLFDFFLVHGADVNALDGGGQTALHTAMRSPISFAKRLIDHGAKVDVRDKYGQTPLHFAAKETRADLVRLLISKGADALIEGSTGNTPLFEASSARWDANDDDLIAIIDLLLAAGSDINYMNRNGATLLMNFAGYKTHEKVFEYLIKKGADVNAKESDGYTALHSACRHASPNLITLLKYGAKKDALWKNYTPLELLESYHPEETDLIRRMR